MTAYQLLPALDAEQYDALRADIRAHGIRVPVDVDENGQVLDGHHRSLIAAELGIDCPRRIVADLTEAEKVAHAIAVNAHRRHLTREQKRDLLAASIKAEPEASDREHARRVGTSHPTAADVRRELVDSGDVEELSTRRDAAGRHQPASKPLRPVAKVTETIKTETVVDTSTGEVLSDVVPFDSWATHAEKKLTGAPTPEPNPIVAARAAVARQPVIVTGKAIERLRLARQTFLAAGSANDVVADLANTPADLDNSGFWLDEIDAAIGVLTDLAGALRRRYLRSVTR
jgi:hypothetical protein